jgi:hypothetical protein
MSAPGLDEMLRRLVKVPATDEAAFAERLGVALRPAGDNPHWRFFEFELPSGPLRQGELRLSRSGDRALLSLQPREPGALLEEDLDLGQWGPLHNLEISPDIPPEGTETYIYHLDGVQLMFQVTHASRRVQAIALHYGLTPSTRTG